MSEESLLESVEDTSNGEETTGQESNVVHDAGQGWMYADSVKGEGEAPEWFKGDKYKSVSDQAAAYVELEKKFGDFTGAPEAYEIPKAEHFAESIDLPEGIEFDLDQEDPLLQAFMPVAQEMGISQDGFNKLVGLYIQQQVNDYAGTIADIEEQKASLGGNSQARLQNLADWGMKNLDPEMKEKYESIMTSAAAVEVVEHLIAKTRNARLPNAADVTPAPAVSKQEVDEMMAAKDNKGRLRYFEDPVYRKSVQEKLKALYGNEPHREVMNG